MQQGGKEGEGGKGEKEGHNKNGKSCRGIGGRRGKGIGN